MKKFYWVTIGVFTSFMSISGAANADWTCNVNGQASCYINYVELYTPDVSGASDTYILGYLSDPLSQTSCNVISVKKGSIYGNPSVDTIKMAEAMLTTALMTQMPVKFVIVKQTGTTCWINNLVVQKPSN